MLENKNNKITAYPPVVVVMGHIDHGKSTLLDYIRKTSITENETGGITQRISAYEVIHQDEKKQTRKITFLDTPGHEAFSKMRERGAKIADIAILVVSASEGVKMQTIEAWKTIVESKTPCIVAINKIDKEDANIEKTKKELAENEIYLENQGGTIPFVEISAKVGTGINDLLSLILILAEVENLTGNSALPATGFVIEVNLDSRRGIMATLIIKNGSIKKGMTVVVEDTMCSTRIMENFLGKTIDEATFSSPIRVVGFDKMPRVGAQFKTFQKKSEAGKYIENWKTEQKKIPTQKISPSNTDESKKIIPIILKADVSGSIEAIEKEIAKINYEPNAIVGKNAKFKIVVKGVGPISESDMKGISCGADALVIGFNVKADSSALEIAEKRDITITFFDIIYKMTQWLETQMEEKRPKVETIEVTGQAKIIRAFSRTKERQIVGGKVNKGKINLNSTIRIIRREFEIGSGKIVNLEKNKTKVSAVEEGTEFGMMLESKIEIAGGDIIESFIVIQK
ncbi:translation initiation factor IF-2 [Patescibacteria group bacterium]|nr:translation initiation factor IF-2 [Patescibacteria group bacterium]